GRLRADYMALANPPEFRRAAEQPSLRLARQLTDLIEDIVTPEPGGDRAALAARGRMAKRRYAQLGFDLEEITEHLPPAHPGTPARDIAMGTDEVTDLGEQLAEAENETARRA